MKRFCPLVVLTPLTLRRLIVGAGLGFASATVPLYIAEVSPDSIRYSTDKQIVD